MGEFVAGAADGIGGESKSGEPILRNRSILAIVTSETISSLGSQMSFLAIPWFVLATTGSATKMGLVFAAELLPIAILGMPSGLVVQRLGVRRLMIISDAVRAVVVASIPVLHAAGLLAFPVLLCVLFVLGALTAPYVSAQRLVIPEAVGADEALVMRGNALIEGATRLATLLGPAVAGVLIGFMGPVNVLWLDAATFLVSCLILTLGLPRPTLSLADAAAPAGGFLDGARFVLGNRLLRRVTVAALIFGTFFPMLLAALPILADRAYGGDARIAGLLFGAWGGGALLGTYGVLRIASRIPPMRLGAMAAVAMAVPLWLAPLPLPWWGMALVLLASGVFTPMLNSPVITLIMLRTPEHLRAHTITFVMTANLLAGPLGYALAGPIAERFGTSRLLLIVAAGVSVAAMLLASMIRVDTQPEDASTTEALATA